MKLRKLQLILSSFGRNLTKSTNLLRLSDDKAALREYASNHQVS